MLAMLIVGVDVIVQVARQASEQSLELAKLEKLGVKLPPSVIAAMSGHDAVSHCASTLPVCVNCLAALARWLVRCLALPGGAGCRVQRDLTDSPIGVSLSVVLQDHNEFTFSDKSLNVHTVDHKHSGSAGGGGSSGDAGAAPMPSGALLPHFDESAAACSCVPRLPCGATPPLHPAA
jgi:hypothetical protein